MKFGDRVEILQSKFITGLKHRKKHPVIGVVMSTNGAYIMVKPNYCSWELEAYENEVKYLNRQKTKTLL